MKEWPNFNEAGDLIISRLSPEGFEEISRARLIEPTPEQLRERRGVSIHLGPFDRLEKRHALVAAHGHPRIARSQQRVIHE